MDWIVLRKNNLPPLNEDVLVVRPPKKGGVSPKPIINIAYLFELKKGERQGCIYGESGQKTINLSEGGIFWAFPAITRFEDVSHWRPMPKLPDCYSQSLELET